MREAKIQEVERRVKAATAAVDALESAAVALRAARAAFVAFADAMGDPPPPTTGVLTVIDVTAATLQQTADVMTGAVLGVSSALRNEVPS